MAYYAALSSTIEFLEDILHPYRSPNSYPAKAHTLKSLHQQFTRLLDSLQDCSPTAVADCVLTRIRDAAYQALDILEQHTLDILEQHTPITDEPKVPKYLLIFNKVWKSLNTQLTRFDCENELQKVGEEVDSIVQELNAIKENQMREHLHLHYDVVASEQPTIGISGTSTMVGFTQLLTAIKDQLCGWSTQLQVISIVGMGGIGKTTLARNIFEDALIVHEFDFHGWVTISQEYNAIRVLLHVAKSLGITTQPDELSGGQDETSVEMDEGEKELIGGQDEASMETVEDEKEKEMRLKDLIRKLKDQEKEKEMRLKNHIHKYLKDRKFLIVIDDVWNTQVWDDIKHAFPNEFMRSRIVLTTRLVDVAEYVGSTDCLHQMQLLNMDGSWTLLQEKAFGEECCPPELVDVGKLIASKCRGLPLAIIVVGGILSNDKTLQYWENVATNVGYVLNKHDEHLSNILSLSYNHLPHQLKPCFLYMGSFPEDYEINISKLIKLWIAEGFLKSDCNSKSLEIVGEEYLKDLVKRSLVIITKKRANGDNKSCVMHDLLRDFCRQRSLHEQFFHVTDQWGRLQTYGVEKVRRIVLNSFTPSTPWANANGKYVRSICWFSKRNSSINVDCFKRGSARHLRILDAANLSSIPAGSNAFLGKSHLKYLAFKSMSHFVPRSIFMFQNLETLIISSFKLILFPSEIWEMVWLKYLITDGMLLSPIPNDIHHKKLEYLHTLETVEEFELTHEATQMISNVRKLKIRCHDVWGPRLLSNLVNILQLEKLSIDFSGHVRDTDLLCRRLAFPQNLMKLCLIECELPWEALTEMGVGSLKCLQVLKLGYKAFVGQVWESVEGEFLELKFLLLDRLDIKHWRVEITHFPKLQHLKISDCRKLEEIPLDIGEIGTLELITVHGSMCARDSAKKILEEQQELGNYGLQVIVHDYPCQFKRDLRWT